MIDLYQKEQDSVLNFILHERFFKHWEKKESNRHLAELELYITSECNQHCTYCYLANRGDELYPKAIRKQEIIIQNLKILLNWLLEQNYHISNLELFSGEIWHFSFGQEILNIILSYLQQGLDIENIIIPSNGTFIQNPKTLNIIQTLINKYQRVKKSLIFSLSIDGKIIEESSRPRNDHSIREDEFYEKAFSFAKRNGFCFHPMISASNVKYWKENYLWFYEKAKEYQSSDLFTLMTLEVRNDDWTEESLVDYADFLKFDLDFVYKNCFKENLEEFTNFLVEEKDCKRIEDRNYLPYKLLEIRTKSACCSIPFMLTIRLGDLMICPCHRMAVPEFQYGQFIVENDKITGIKANNTYMAHRILMSNNNTASLKCDSCIFNEFCCKGCYGAQYEHNKDPFLPIPCVCKLIETKIRTIFTYFEETGIFKLLEQWEITAQSYPTARHLLDLRDEIKRLDKEGIKINE